MNNEIKISIVSPVYKGEHLVDELVNRVLKAVSTITSDFEIVLVDDGSPDNSWEQIELICKNIPQVKGIKLSRNFGQHYAITAGINICKGERVVIMDCDLQDRPEDIPNLFNKALEGFDIVYASRKNRSDNFFRRSISKLFYFILSYLTGVKYDESIANFGIYNRKVISAINTMKESIRVFPIMVKWSGFKSTKIEVEHPERLNGKSSYNFKRLLNLGIDIILSYSDKPIIILIKTGVLISILSFLVSIYYVYKWYVGEIKLLGWTSLIVSIWFLSGIIISTLGIIGLYIGKTFNEVKKRPLYLIDEKINF